MDQLNMFDLFGAIDAPATPVKETKKASAKDAKKEKDSPKAPEKVSLPVTIVAPTWTTTIEDLEESQETTIPAIVKFLVDEGFDEVKMSTVSLVKGAAEGYLFVAFNSLEEISSNDTLVDFEKPVVIVQGQTKMELTKESFVDIEEVTIKDLTDRWAQTYPDFEGCNIYFDFTNNIGYPVLPKKVTDAVGVKGETTTLTIGGVETSSVEITGEVKVSNLYAIAFAGHPFKDVVWYENGNSTLLQYIFKTYDYKQNKGEFTASSTKVDIKVKEEKVSLPITVTFTHAADMVIAPEQVGGKEKATFEEIRCVVADFFEEYTKEKAEFIYFKSSNVLEARIKSSKRG